jgi:OOP family OmpA-OmpF porin
MYKRIALNGLAIASLAFGAAAHADVAPGYYAGLSLGQGSIDVEGLDESDTAFKLFGGYTFNEYFAVEASYIDGGSPEKSVAMFGLRSAISADVSALNVSAVGRLALNDAFTLFGKAGLARYEVDGSIRVEDDWFGDWYEMSFEDSGTELSFGVGGEYSFGQFGLRAEYESIEDLSVLSIGGTYRF